MRDLRYALRALRRSPGFACIAVLSLALGTGANTAIFSLIDALLLKSLPVRHPDELARLIQQDARGITNSFDLETFNGLRSGGGVFSGVLASASPGRVNLAVDAAAEPPSDGVRLVSGDFFSVLGVDALLGRVLAADDDHAAVLSHRFWKRRFALDPAVLGRTVRLNGSAFTVVGVMRPEFFGLRIGDAPDLWVPLAAAPLLSSKPPRLDVVARLGRGLPLQEAAPRANHLFAQVRAETGRRDPFDRLRLEPAGKGTSRLSYLFAKPLFILMALVALLLAIACANVANLMLARAAGRDREMAVRIAVGASRWRIVRQLLVESALVAAMGGAAGLLFAWWLGALLLRLMSPEAAPLEFRADARVLAFTAAVSLATAIAFGLAPALTAASSGALAARRTQDARRSRLAGVLVAAQAAICVVLLAGAGLFLRTLRNLKAVDPGFNPESVLLFRVDAAPAGYRGERLAPFYRELLDRLNALPGVRSATVSSNSLLSGIGGLADVSIAGRVPRPEDSRKVWRNLVGPAFFTTMGMEVLLGRDLTARDDAAAPKVAVVNQAMARYFFGAESPVGRRLGLGGPETSRDIEIAGVVRDAKDYSLRGETPPVVYLPFWQHPFLSEMNVEVRAAGSPSVLVAPVRRELAAIDKHVAPFGFKTQARQRDESLARERSVATLAALFAALALVLASIGLYGVMSCAVARRTGEIGVRMALGARPADVLALVLRHAVLLAGAGAAAGLVAALAAARLVSSLLFGLAPSDPASFAGAAAVLAAVALAAAYLPARRAARLDPVAAIRHE